MAELTSVITKKVTKRDNFTSIISVLESCGKDELVKVMEHEIELLDKKASAKKSTSSKKATENAQIVEQVYSVLRENGCMTTSDIMVACGLSSTQFALARANDLVAQGKARKGENDKKRVVFYPIADDEE